jgi:type VI secretion system protein
MCATRVGTVLTAPDYGIPDVTEMLHSFPDAIGEMRKALKYTIEKYEPRLTNVRVNFIQGGEEDLICRFEIVAQLVNEEGPSRVKFETTLEVSRKISVR